MMPRMYFFILRQRPYSIKTRIKTAISQCVCINGCVVRDHIPSKQGLRLESNIIPLFL